MNFNRQEEHKKEGSFRWVGGWVDLKPQKKKFQSSGKVD